MPQFENKVDESPQVFGGNLSIFLMGLYGIYLFIY